jgi:hypothetical protein
MSDALALTLRLGGVGIGFPLLAWVFGSALLGRFTRLDREERFVAGFGVGFAAVALCAFVAFVLHAPQPYFNLGAVALMLGTALLCRMTTHRFLTEYKDPLWPMAAVFALAYLHLVCIQALLPAYRGSYWYYDWWMHFDEARVFVGDEPIDTKWANGYTLASRTPLFNLATAFVMGLAGHDFSIYQLASAATNICFVLALSLLLRDLFGRRAAWLALLLAPLNLWMLHNSWFTWPKMLAAYYVILALHFYLRSLRERPINPARAAEYFYCVVTASLLGFVTHQAVLAFVLPLLLHAVFTAVRGGAYRELFTEFLAAALLGLAVGGPWYAWLAGNLGMTAITGSTPVTLGDENAHFDVVHIAEWMGLNLGASVVPVGIGQAVFAVLPADPVELNRGLTQLYFSLVTGALTISLLVFLLAAAWRRLRYGPSRPATKPAAGGWSAWGAVWLFLSLGTLGAAFLHPGKIPWGIAHSAAFPGALVLTALAWGVLSRARPAVAALVCVGMVLEFLLMFWSHWWLLWHDPEVLQPGASTVGPRETWEPLLNEVLGSADRLFLAGAVAVQAALVVPLFRSLRRAEVKT